MRDNFIQFLNVLDRNVMIDNINNFIDYLEVFYICINMHILPMNLQKRLDRHEMFDFIPIVADGLIVAMYPQPPEFDIGLFIRPYRQER